VESMNANPIENELDIYVHNTGNAPATESVLEIFFGNQSEESYKIGALNIGQIQKISIPNHFDDSSKILVLLDYNDEVFERNEADNFLIFDLAQQDRQNSLTRQQNSEHTKVGDQSAIANGNARAKNNIRIISDQ
jgi:hypothetical protein